MRHITFRFLAALALFAPSLVLAAAQIPSGINKEALKPYTLGIRDVINVIIVPTLIGIALLLFLWGIFKYFILQSDKAKDEGKQFAMWGIIGFVIIFALWGIVYLVMSIFGLSDNTATPKPPIFGTSGQTQQSTGGATLPSSNTATQQPSVQDQSIIDSVLCDTIGVYCPTGSTSSQSSVNTCTDSSLGDKCGSSGSGTCAVGQDGLPYCAQ